MASIDEARLQFAPGVRPFLRAPGVIQFGADATRTGMITTEHADKLLAELRKLARPRSTRAAVRGIGEHLGEDAARSLVADLVAYRLLVPERGPQALVIGGGALTTKIHEVLAGAGVTVRSPMPHEAAATFLKRHDPWPPIVAVNCDKIAGELAGAARSRRGPLVPVTHLDARVLIGPVCAAPGPCPMCAQLYLLERDPNWDLVCGHMPGGTSPEPTSLSAGAALAALAVRRLAGVPDPPGVSGPMPAPGEVISVDPFAAVPVTRTNLSPHPGCPVCF